MHLWSEAKCWSETHLKQQLCGCKRSPKSQLCVVGSLSWTTVRLGTYTLAGQVTGPLPCKSCIPQRRCCMADDSPYKESSSCSKPVAESTPARRGSSTGSTKPYWSREWSILATIGEYVCVTCRKYPCALPSQTQSFQAISRSGMTVRGWQTSAHVDFLMRCDVHVLISCLLQRGQCSREFAHLLACLDVPLGVAAV